MMKDSDRNFRANWSTAQFDVPTRNCVSCVKLSRQQIWAVFGVFPAKIKNSGCTGRSANNSHKTWSVVKLAGRGTWLFSRQCKQASRTSLDVPFDCEVESQFTLRPGRAGKAPAVWRRKEEVSLTILNQLHRTNDDTESRSFVSYVDLKWSETSVLTLHLWNLTDRSPFAVVSSRLV